MAPSFDDFLVRAAERQVQEAERIEDGLRRVPERLDQRLDGGFGGARAVGMPTHAVDHDQQGRVLGDRDGDAILIVGAITEQADFGVFDAQGVVGASDKLPRTLLHPAPFKPRSSSAMIASMTGFARRELAGTFGTLTCELRSVNHRYLEPGFACRRSCGRSSPS